MGPLAFRFRDRVELLLQERRRWRADWVSVELAYAHFRITGDPVLCVEVLDKALDPLRRKQQLPVTRQVLRYLAELGPAAVRFKPLLGQVIEQDEALALAAAALSAIAQ